MTSEKTLCPHGWPEPLQPCPACTRGKFDCDAMDASRTEPRRFTGLDATSGPDQSVEIKYQLKGEGVEVASITDKPDTKNTRDDWFQLHGALHDAEEHARPGLVGVFPPPVPSQEVYADMVFYRGRLDNAQRQIFNMASELRVLRQACKAAGDEIRELHAQRKPEQHGAYWLTFPECSTSRGMYWAMAGLLAAGGLLLAWWLA